MTATVRVVLAPQLTARPAHRQQLDVQVSAAKPWESLMASGIWRSLPDPAVQDAEVIE